MAKKNPKNWARIDDDLWREFKSELIKRGQKVYEAQTEAIRLYLNKKEK